MGQSSGALGIRRHKKLKENHEKGLESGKQLTLYVTEVRQRQKEKEATSGIHDFMQALSYSAISLNQADGFVGMLFRKYIPSTRSMPTQ